MVIVRIYEGLGNQLFQYAYARALSLASNHKVFLDVRNTGSKKGEEQHTPREYGLKHYRISLPICTNVRNFYPYLNETDNVLEFMQKFSTKWHFPYKFFKEDTPEYKKELINIQGNWYLQGWFQDARYFDKYTDIIRKEIVPKNRIKISSELRNILKSQNTVSIHIRRSDYKRNLNVLPVKYYDNAINRMKDMVKNPFWLVFSDEVEWVKRNMDFGQDCYFIDKKENIQDYEELMVMSKCKHHVIANSTYSWWGAWLGQNEDKIVIGPDRWLMKKNQDCGKQIMPKNWIKESVL